MDKKLLIVLFLGLFAGIALRILIVIVLEIEWTEVIASHLNVQVQTLSVNNTVNIPLNETKLIEAINQTSAR